MTITEQTAVSIPTGTWRADPVHSSVTFEVQYLGVSTFSGAVQNLEATLSDGLIAGSAEIASLETKDENLKAHLLSPEFFDAERFPKVSFSSTAVETDGDQVEFEGSITIKGV